MLAKYDTEEWNRVRPCRVISLLLTSWYLASDIYLSRLCNNIGIQTFKYV